MWFIATCILLEGLVHPGAMKDFQLIMICPMNKRIVKRALL